ncbi:MAG: hypothetical protein KBA61_16995 [Spirochaetes bacterium]|nr:hypothetical protein [Spirochaetota bacterium]
MDPSHAVKKVAEELSREVDRFYAKHRGLSDEITSINLAADAWSPKEIIGHLVDSAANNHQRFVHLMLEEELRFPEYFAEPWIGAQHFNGVEWQTLITLWRSYNLVLANIVRSIKPESLKHEWVLENNRVSLEFLVVDYLRHLRDHMTHFEKRLDELRAAGHGI